MYCRSALLVLLSTTSFGVLVNSFVPQPINFLPSNFKTALDAKTKKKKKATTTRTSGFGTVVEKKGPKKKNENDDYAAFPALQDTVKNTLIPSTAEDQENARDLPNQLYDRLGQIYGYTNFNFPSGWFDDEQDEIEKEESTSFNDLLTSGNSNSNPSSVGSDFGDLLKPKNDFSDLIASASGGTIEGGDASKTLSKQLPIEKLPPFSKFRVLHVDPMVLAIDDFFTDEECDEYVEKCANPKKRTVSNDMPMMSRSKTVGKDSLAEAQRTSTTWFHHFKSVPALMAKASRLLGLRTIDRWEEPQTVRYQPQEKFTWHLDALAPSDSLNEMGGQRVATLLVYLTDLGPNLGGSTLFRDLGSTEGEFLKVQPKKGSALLFFPAAGGIPETPFDIRTLHAGEAVASDSSEDKWIAQMWLRENDSYKPSAPPGNSHAMASETIEEYCVL
jgi:hypothetical protein